VSESDPENIVRGYIISERDAGRLTQSCVAKNAGLSVSFMSDWLNYKRHISVQNFAAVCDAVGIKWSVTIGKRK